MNKEKKINKKSEVFVNITQKKIKKTKNKNE